MLQKACVLEVQRPGPPEPYALPLLRLPCRAASASAAVRRYNTVMKLVFLVSSATIVYYMRFHRVVRNTYDKEVDTFRVAFLVGPCLLFALLINQEFTLLEVRKQGSTHYVFPAKKERKQDTKRPCSCACWCGCS